MPYRIVSYMRSGLAPLVEQCTVVQ